MMLESSWTDVLFLGLILSGVLWLGYGLRHPAMRRALRSLSRQKLAVASGLILGLFFGIAILDCIHIGQQTVLDNILSPLNKGDEKTFSAPLALEAYVTEAQLIGDQYVSSYPTLRYPARMLHTLQERDRFIYQQGGFALLSGLVMAGLVWLIGALYARLRYQQPIQVMNPAYRTACLTLGGMVFLSIWAYGVSRQLHVFGTGKIGQDIFYYAVKSVRTGLVIGMLTTFFTLPFALFLGVAAGYFGGWVDDVIQYLYTTLSSIPGVLLITASVLSMQTFIANHADLFPTLNQQADARLLALCFILGVTSWTSLCRLLRAEAMHLKHIDYVLAAKVLGSSSLRILRQHLLPNVTHIVMITLVLDFSYLILAEAVLTYVGVGVSPMTMSWGNMINSARLELARDPVVWWPVLAAFMMMFTLVLASNVFADAVETAWNPKTNEG
ncbi:MAG: ABC transporter permease [Gammaproteobacteria bacterium]|nr:ABC transporter permease [Gammaproteobacteria bacterium]